MGIEQRQGLFCVGVSTGFTSFCSNEARVGVMELGLEQQIFENNKASCLSSLLRTLPLHCPLSAKNRRSQVIYS